MSTPVIKLRPSDAHRWLVCRVSPHYVAVNQHRIPDRQFEYTIEGQLAHEAAAQLLTKGTLPPKVSKEMAKHVEAYAAYVRKQVNLKKHTVYIEQAVDVYFNPSKKGYVDTAIIANDGSNVHIIDLKYGRGVSVGPVKNPQLSIYLRSLLDGWVDLFTFTKKTKIKLTIYQPRVPGEQTVRTWETTWEDLIAHTDWIASVAQDILANPSKQEFEPSDATCQFCPAEEFCEARASDLLGETPALPVVHGGADIAPVGEWPTPASLTLDQINRILKVQKPLQKWLDDLNEYAALMSLQKPDFKLPDFKVVASNPHRKWTDEDEAEKVLRGMFPRTEVISEKLVSPAQALEMMKARKCRTKSWQAVQALITKPDGNPVLAPADDPRPLYKDADVSEEFADEDTSLL